MTRRLLTFLVLFFLLLGGLELFVRANGESFEALSDRLAFQIRVFERSPEDTAALFLGTSRFADAIDQTVFGKEVAEQTGEPTWAVNCAMAGINLGETLQFAEVVADSSSLPRVIVEASSPSVSLGAPRASEGGADKPAEDPDSEDPFPTRMENGLQSWFGEHSSLIRYRTALRPRTFLRLAVLYSANFIDPGKWSRKGLVRELLTSNDFEIPEKEFEDLQPIRFGPSFSSGRRSGVFDQDVAGDPIYQGMAEVAEVLKKGSAEVFWVAPPVTESMKESEGNDLRHAVYNQIASEYGVIILDYSGIPIDESLFRDRSHLNEKGRTLFSKLVARDLADSF